MKRNPESFPYDTMVGIGMALIAISLVIMFTVGVLVL
jgi:hypothetical protein